MKFFKRVPLFKLKSLMKILKIPSFIILILFLNFYCSGKPVDSIEKRRSFSAKNYNNLFAELLNKTEDEVSAKIRSAYNQLFYGNDSTERIYYPVEPDMAYIEDILHNDVRSEGMSYGMMIAVQLDKQTEFNRLWKWAKTYMQHKSGPPKNYFAWQLKPDGTIIDATSASDGEEWIVLSLFFASGRWGNGDGIFNYKAEAQKILDAMINKELEPGNDGTITNMFNRKEKMVVFVPEPQADDFTDPSYHLPHFYELWGKWSNKENQFCLEAAAVSRTFFKKAAHPATGLFPDYSRFDGTPYNPFGSGSDDFRYDARRVAMNIAVDYQWFAEDEWAVEQCNRLLNFFHKQGIGRYGDLYTLEGKNIGKDHSTGLVAMNAVAALASANENRKEFVRELWETNIPSGLYRYYDSVLYMLGMLQVSGNFKIYDVQ